MGWDGVFFAKDHAREVCTLSQVVSPKLRGHVPFSLAHFYVRFAFGDEYSVSGLSSRLEEIQILDCKGKKEGAWSMEATVR